MRLACEKDRDHILEYLHKDVNNCVYLYIDIVNYGVSSENMKVWIQEENADIVLVVMKYYDSFQIYSHVSDANMEEVAKILNENPVSMISGRKDLIENLHLLCPQYNAIYGSVYLLDKYRNMERYAGEVTEATVDDTKEIAELICADKEIGTHYTVDNLSKQLRDRISTGTGRSYIVRRDGKVVAHTATYAEANDIAVVGGTIVDPDYRDRILFSIISNEMLKKLSEKGIRAYAFSFSDKMVKYHDRVHTKCGEYGKLEK